MTGQTQTIAVTGPRGLVASAVRATLEQSSGSFRVLGISRSEGPDTVVWSPSEGRIDASALEGVDAVVHLAGESIGPARWSKERRQRIRSSRVEGSRLLAETFASMARPPRVLVQASAMGYYGDTGDDWVTESSPRGDGFLAEVCEAWEGASRPATEAGVRVVHLRLGHVLGEGGLLEALKTPTKLGLGGRLGSGRQFMSWIGIVDLVALIVECLGDPTLSGVVNAVTPNPQRNADFIEAYAGALRRPAWLPVPALALRMAFGREQAQEMLLWGQRVRPAVLIERGFEFTWPRLEQALTAIVAGDLPLPVERANGLVVAGTG